MPCSPSSDRDYATDVCITLRCELEEAQKEITEYRSALKQIVHNPGWMDPEVGFMSGHIAAGVLNQFPENEKN